MGSMGVECWWRPPAMEEMRLQRPSGLTYPLTAAPPLHAVHSIPKSPETRRPAEGQDRERTRSA